jgi:hypothetical protein
MLEMPNDDDDDDVYLNDYNQRVSHKIYSLHAKYEPAKKVYLEKTRLLIQNKKKIQENQQ